MSYLQETQDKLIKEIKRFCISHVIKKKARQYDYDKIKLLIYAFDPFNLKYQTTEDKIQSYTQSYTFEHENFNMFKRVEVSKAIFSENTLIKFKITKNQ